MHILFNPFMLSLSNTALGLASLVLTLSLVTIVKESILPNWVNLCIAISRRPLIKNLASTYDILRAGWCTTSAFFAPIVRLIFFAGVREPVNIELHVSLRLIIEGTVIGQTESHWLRLSKTWFLLEATWGRRLSYHYCSWYQWQYMYLKASTSMVENMKLNMAGTLTLSPVSLHRRRKIVLISVAVNSGQHATV